MGHGPAGDDGWEVQAYAWYSLAAAQGYESGAQGRAMITATLSPEQLSQAQALAAALQAKIDNRQAPH